MTDEEVEAIRAKVRRDHRAYMEEWFDWEGHTVPAEERRAQMSRVLGPATSRVDPD